MRSLKKLIAPAVGGFVLSFFISLIATKGNFGVALLRGLLFAVIFAGLFFLADFLFAKFLDGSSSDSATRKSEPGVGNKVDITLTDEDLADDGDDLKFFVGQNKMGLNTSGSEGSRVDSGEPIAAAPSASVSNDAPRAQTEKAAPMASTVSRPAPEVASGTTAQRAPDSEPKSTFRPVPLGTPEPTDSVAPLSGESEKVKDLDSLPEISDFDSDLGSEEGSESNSGGDDGYISDTDFSGQNSSLYNRKKPSDDVTSGHDAETLAKAIQTILKKDE